MTQIKNISQVTKKAPKDGKIDQEKQNAKLKNRTTHLSYQQKKINVPYHMGPETKSMDENKSINHKMGRE